MQSNASRLQELLRRKRILSVAGANDGLSARLAERAGFDALWASGLAISTSHGVPDASILSMSEMLEAARVMSRSSGLPVIADCDTGFGGPTNIDWMVRCYEREGIAAVCIEDKVFPKNNSYRSGQKLLDPCEFGARIEVAKAAQQTAEFMVIARIESFIAGRDLDDALERAAIYTDAGADALLVHSKRKDLDEIAAFAEAWRDRSTPLVAVPTSYVSGTRDVLARLGYKIVIFANQALRSAVAAMEQVLSELARNGDLSRIEDELCSVQHLFELVDTDATSAVAAAGESAAARLRHRHMESVTASSGGCHDEAQKPD